MPHSRKVLVVATNLFFLPRVQNIAAPSGCETRQVMTVDRLHEEMADGETVLVLVDLEADPEFWGEAVRAVLAGGEGRPQVVGYGGHTNTAMLEKAQKVGCDLVLTKGQFSRDLGKLISNAARSDPRSRTPLTNFGTLPHSCQFTGMHPDPRLAAPSGFRSRIRIRGKLFAGMTEVGVLYQPQYLVR